MNKKSFILSLILAGSFLTPQPIYSGPTALFALPLWAIGMGVTTIITTGNFIKEYTKKYSRVRNFLKKKDDIREYQITITILPRIKNTRKFNQPLETFTYSSKSYTDIVEKTKNIIEKFEINKLQNLDKKTILKFVIETGIELKNGKIYKLQPKTIYKKIYLSSQLTAYDKTRIIKILKDKFYIPKFNIQYKQKALLSLLVGTIASTGTALLLL